MYLLFILLLQSVIRTEHYVTVFYSRYYNRFKHTMHVPTIIEHS
jgi:hypothetical protein